MKISSLLLGWGILFVAVAGTIRAEVALPPVFSEHAVLQRSARTPVWGKADPGEKVVVSVGAARAETVAATDGRWRATLDLSQISNGPFDLVVEGRNRLVIPDVVIGKVWLCSGQSNMEWPLGRDKGMKVEAALPANRWLRHFKAEKQSSAAPLDEIKGTWTVASPETLPRFGAVAYYFGKELQAVLQEPVGLLNNSWGGSWAEAWTSLEALESDPELSEKCHRILGDLEKAPQRQRDYAEALRNWQSKFRREDRPAPDPAVFLAGTETPWKPATVPGRFAAQGLPDSGAVWLRKKVEITPDMLGNNLAVVLGTISGFDTVYFNGKEIGSTTVETPGASGRFRAYHVPASRLQVGQAELALRIFNPGEGGGLLSDRTQIRIGLVNISGQWLAREEFAFDPLTAVARQSFPKPPPVPAEPKGTPTYLFNGMLHPLLGYGIEGVIWYQGESNGGQAAEYRRLFPLMIRDWRQRWGQGDIPFFFCQLANYGAKLPEPGESVWAELREAQNLALHLPHTGQAVLIDSGEEQDIHPRDKSVAGHRLALLALAQLYGKPVCASGPVPAENRTEAGKIWIRFDHADGGLVARPLPDDYQPRSTSPQRVPLVRNSPGSALQGFAICGADHQWVWAQATIEGNTVIVWSDRVASPVAVRYGWSNNPTCNLYNGAGLPAGPFRTDSFPLTTESKKK